MDFDVSPTISDSEDGLQMPMVVPQTLRERISFAVLDWSTMSGPKRRSYVLLATTCMLAFVTIVCGVATLAADSTEAQHRAALAWFIFAVAQSLCVALLGAVVWRFKWLTAV